MFDKFKKPDEEQNNGEQNATEPIANLEQPCIEEKPRQETSAPSTQEPFETAESDMLSLLESLGGEERTLVAEKSQLVTMEENLRQKIIDEIEVKRHRIENLKYEIPELKQRCEALAKALDIPIQK